jgi:hypothetical protein
MSAVPIRFYGQPWSPPLVQVDISFLAHQVGVAPPNALDLGQGVHDLLFPVDIGVKET